MKKRVISLALVLILAITVIACGGGGELDGKWVSSRAVAGAFIELQFSGNKYTESHRNRIGDLLTEETGTFSISDDKIEFFDANNNLIASHNFSRIDENTIAIGRDGLRLNRTD